MVTVLLVVLLSGSVYGQFLQEELSEPTLDVPHGIEKPPLVVALADESAMPDSGNWYEKLKWWKEAKWTYTVDVLSAMEALAVLEDAYKLRKHEMLAKIDEYSASLPVKRELAEKEIDDLIEDMVRRQNEIAKEETNKRDESQSDELEQQKKMLSDLKKKFTQFNTLATRVKQAFDDIVPKRLADAKVYDGKALKAYKTIEDILDDKKAEQLFNEVENSLENIKAITNYLKGPLNAFLDRAWAKAQEVMPQIISEIQRLEDEGVVVRPLSPDEKEQMTAIEKQRIELKEKRAAEAKAAKQRAALPWYQKAFAAVGSFFSQVGSWVKAPFVWIGSWFGGSAEAQKKPEVAKVMLPQELPVVPLKSKEVA